MKAFFLRKALPVAAGLLVAFAVMMAFEYVNSFYYPLPEGIDFANPAALREFTATLPWTAYVLVLTGWATGSFFAGIVVTLLSKETTYSLSLAVGIILTLLGIANNITIGHDMFFNIIGLPMFLIFTYLGHCVIRKRQNTLQ